MVIYTGNVVSKKTARDGAKKDIPRNYHGMFNITGGWGGRVPLRFTTLQNSPMANRCYSAFLLRFEPPVGVSSSQTTITIKIKCPKGHLIFMADGEGFEPPVELPPQRFSRPSHSTALPPILNLYLSAGLSNLRFCYEQRVHYILFF